MAERPVYVPLGSGWPWVRSVCVEFQWFAGLSLSQAQRSIRALHEGAKRAGVERALEISTRATQSLGVALSAFNLQIEIAGRRITVESAFQGSKVLDGIGPLHDLYWCSSRDAKRDERVRSGARVIAFDFAGEKWVTEPRTAFYDFLYLTALRGGERLGVRLAEYDGFTDIAFNPKKSVNCQARSAALFVALSQAGMLEEALSSQDRFVATLEGESSEPGGGQQELF